MIDLHQRSSALRIIVAHSLDPDTAYTSKELLERCRRDLKGETPRAAILLSAIDADHRTLLGDIQRAFPGIALIGCTTDGELSSHEGFQEGTTTLMLFVSDVVEFSTGLGRELSKSPTQAAKSAVRQALAGLTSPPSLCLITPESLTTSANKLLDALRAELGPNFPIFGGLASDQWRFEKTRQFFADETLVDSVPILLLGGPLRFSHGIASGWQPLGTPSVIRESTGNIVQRIGDLTALDYYRRYLGYSILPSGECPLAVFEPESERHYLRAPLAHDPRLGTITFAGDLPIGAKVQLTTATREQIVAASRTAIEAAKTAYPGDSPTSAIVFSCAARKQILGTRTGEEHSALKSVLGSAIPVCGFYAYGEFSPLACGGEPRFHNETIVTLLLGTE